MGHPVLWRSTGWATGVLRGRGSAPTFAREQGPMDAEGR
jgi:hypothetical protein